jgi:hypothetical protein
MTKSKELGVSSGYLEASKRLTLDKFVGRIPGNATVKDQLLRGY